MKVKKGMIVEFVNPCGYDAVGWFLYAVASGALGMVESYGGDKVSCRIVKWDDKLREMKLGNNKVITDIDTVRQALYREK